MKRSVVLTVAAFVLAVLLAGLPGCAPPVEVGKCVVAARVDAVQTAKELRAMHPDPATMPAIHRGSVPQPAKAPCPISGMPHPQPAGRWRGAS